MLLLFASTSDVEQIDLRLSLENVQSSLVSVEQQEDGSTEMVPRQRSSASELNYINYTCPGRRRCCCCCFMLHTGRHLLRVETNLRL